MEIKKEVILSIIADKIDEINRQYNSILKNYNENKILRENDDLTIINHQHSSMNVVLEEVYEEIENYFKEIDGLNE